MQARYTLSEDSELRPKGPHTMINYQHDYKTYLQYLHLGLTNRKEKVLEIFDEWNQLFFPEPGSDANSLTGRGGMSRAMASLSGQKEVVEEEMTGGAGGAGGATGGAGGW